MITTRARGWVAAPVLGALVWLCAATTAQAAVYRCQQADGRVAFQAQPCAAGATGDRIAVQVTPPSGDPRPASTVSAPGPRGGPSAAQRLLDGQQRAADAAQRTADRQQTEALRRSINCNTSRNNLGALRTARPVYHYNNQGDKVYIDDQSRQGEIAAARQGVAENCP